MTIDNTTPRYTAALALAAERLNRALPLVPKAVQRLDDMLPGYPTGHTATTSHGDGPQRWQSGDPALRGSEALRDAVEAVTRETDALFRLLTRWSQDQKGDKYATDNQIEGYCRSCQRVGQMPPAAKSKGGLCHWCYDTLRDVNKMRSTVYELPPLAELPVDLVEKHHNRASLGPIRHDGDLQRVARLGDNWQKTRRV